MTKISRLVEISSAAVISIKILKGVASIVAVSMETFEAWKNPLAEVIDAFETVPDFEFISVLETVPKVSAPILFIFMFSPIVAVWPRIDKS